MAYKSTPKIVNDYFDKSQYEVYNAKLTTPDEVKKIARAVVGGESGGGTGEFYEIEPAEVLDIVLDSLHPEFNSKEVGGWEGIGKIKARLLFSEKNKNSKSTNWIKPLNSGFIKYPLLHEIVLTIYAPARNATDDPTVQELYYFTNPVSIYNQLTENAMPNISVSSNVERMKVDEQNEKQVENIKQAEIGINNQQTMDEDIEEDNQLDNPSGAHLGNTYNKNYSIRSLLPFEGDTILEGRHGQSIRLGSTVKFAENSPNIPAGGHFPNWWSETGENGDSILIIRNGQSTDAYGFDIDTRVVEDFDNDAASIYLTNGQEIQFKPACKHMETWDKTHPWTNYSGEAKRPYTFKGKQILMNSDRIVMNSRLGEFMVYANGSIGFSTNGDFHINCRSFKLNAVETHNMNVPTGNGADANKNQPAILGTELVNLLIDMRDAIFALRYPQGVIDYSSTKKLENVIAGVNDILSKNNFVT